MSLTVRAHPEGMDSLPQVRSVQSDREVDQQ